MFLKSLEYLMSKFGWVKKKTELSPFLMHYAEQIAEELTPSILGEVLTQHIQVDGVTQSAVVTTQTHQQMFDLLKSLAIHKLRVLPSDLPVECSLFILNDSYKNIRKVGSKTLVDLGVNLEMHFESNYTYTVSDLCYLPFALRIP